MRWVIALLLQCGQGLNALHFNVRLALFGMLVCGVHTFAALALLALALIPSSTAEQVIDFSMSGTVFLLIGITVSGLLPVLKGKKNAEADVTTAARPLQNVADRDPCPACAVRDRDLELAGPPFAGTDGHADGQPS